MVQRQQKNLIKQQKNMMQLEDVLTKDLIVKKLQLKKLNISYQKKPLILMDLEKRL